MVYRYVANWSFAVYSSSLLAWADLLCPLADSLLYTRTMSRLIEAYTSICMQ
jgi:hypothetical protein